MELPSHPEADDVADHPPTPAGSRVTYVVVAVLVVLLVAMVVLHLSGVVGPASN